MEYFTNFIVAMGISCIFLFFIYAIIGVVKEVSKTITCPWDKCRFNMDGVCNCTKVALTVIVLSDHSEGLDCVSRRFKLEEYGKEETW